MPMAKRMGGRPPKNIADRLIRSINLKLTSQDYDTIAKRANEVALTSTQYVREMALRGVVRSRFTAEELDLMRKLSGFCNNLNQIAKGLNSHLAYAQNDARHIIHEIWKVMYDSKKH